MRAAVSLAARVVAGIGTSHARARWAGSIRPRWAAQIGYSQWFQDYPAASDFLNVLFGCASFRPGSDTSINIAGFCNKPIQAQMDKAEALGATDTTGANAQWAKIDKQVTDQSPAAVLFAPKNTDFVSKRVGNFTFSDQYYMLLDQAWVQ